MIALIIAHHNIQCIAFADSIGLLWAYSAAYGKHALIIRICDQPPLPSNNEHSYNYVQ